MGKPKCVFHSAFRKTRYFEVDNVNYDPVLKMGTCLLSSKHHKYIMCWTVRNYPPELPSMPGAPYPILCSYTIFEKEKNQGYHRGLDSMSGEFVFELNSGTLPNFNLLGLPSGEFRSMGRDNKCEEYFKVKFSLMDDCMEISIKHKKSS